MRDAREDLSWDRRQNLGRGGDAAPPRLSATGFRSLATLLRQRVRADEVSVDNSKARTCHKSLHRVLRNTVTKP